MLIIDNKGMYSSDTKRRPIRRGKEIPRPKGRGIKLSPLRQFA